MRKLILLAVLAIVIAFSGCPFDGGGWQTGTMTLEYNKHFDFDTMQYREYYTECVTSGGAYKGIDGVPDIAAHTELSTKACPGFSGLKCEETSFGTYAKPNENIMLLGKMSLEQASVPASFNGEWEVCAGVGNSYYLKTWQEKDVLFEVTEIGDDGIGIKYKISS